MGWGLGVQGVWWGGAGWEYECMGGVLGPG